MTGVAAFPLMLWHVGVISGRALWLEFGGTVVLLLSLVMAMYIYSSESKSNDPFSNGGYVGF